MTYGGTTQWPPKSPGFRSFALQVLLIDLWTSPFAWILRNPVCIWVAEGTPNHILDGLFRYKGVTIPHQQTCNVSGHNPKVSPLRTVTDNCALTSDVSNSNIDHYSLFTLIWDFLLIKYPSSKIIDCYMDLLLLLSHIHLFLSLQIPNESHVTTIS